MKQSRYEIRFTCDLQGKYSITEKCRMFLTAESKRISNILQGLKKREREARDLNYLQINQHVDRAQTNGELDATLRTINELSKGPLKTLAVINELLEPRNKASALKHEDDSTAADALKHEEYAHDRVRKIEALRREAAANERARPAVAAANRARAIDRRIINPDLDPYNWRVTGGPPPGRGGTRRRMKNPSWKGYKLHGTKKNRKGTGPRTRRRNK